MTKTKHKNTSDTRSFIKCPYCLEEIDSNAKKCKHCGEWLDDQSSEKCNLKCILSYIEPIFKNLLTITSIAAIITGGIWTFNEFIKERKGYPHANIQITPQHIELANDINLLRFVIEFNNTGSSQISIGKYIIRIQQILPLLSCPNPENCVSNQINEALKERVRNEERYSWPIVAKRESELSDQIVIEPGEKDKLDYEFAIPSDVKTVRIYCHISNKKIASEGKEYGWSQSIFYEFKKGKT